MEFFIKINDIVIDQAPICEMDFGTFWEGDMWKTFSKHISDENAANHITIISGAGKKYTLEEFLGLVSTCTNKYWQN